MHIKALIVAAIDTGMRSGEMLALRFADVDLERGLITLRGETTKSRKTRLVPISTTRLRGVFAWLRSDVEGNPKPLETRVFSNELVEPYRLFHRMWQSIVLKAHGHTPTWNPRLNYQGLSDESQETFRRINLRWHDLRHEYASRLVEHGVPLEQVRDLLGHASITTTERYDNQTLANLQVAAAKLERGLEFAARAEPRQEATARSESGSRRPNFQDSFKIAPNAELDLSSEIVSRQGFERVAASAKRAETRLNTGRSAKRRACEEVWLGVRDDFRHYLVHMRREGAAQGASRHEKASPSRSSGPWLHDDLHVAAEKDEESHQPIEREAGKSATDQRRHLGLIHVQQLSRGGLREAPLRNECRNLPGKLRFRERFCGPRMSEVLEHIPAPDDMILARHGLLLRRASAPCDGSLQPLRDQVDVCLRGRDSALRLLLERVQHEDAVADTHRVHRTEGVPAVVGDDLQHARPQPL
jgi:hypothetical protein